MKRNTLILIVFLTLVGTVASIYFGGMPSSNSGKVAISNAIAMPMGNSDDTVMVALELTNEGPPQTIRKVSSPDSHHGMFHGVEGSTQLVVPANSSAAFAMD